MRLLAAKPKSDKTSVVLQTWSGRKMTVPREEEAAFKQEQEYERRIRVAARMRAVISGGAPEASTLRGTPFGAVMNAAELGTRTYCALASTVGRVLIEGEPVKSAFMNEAIDWLISPRTEASLGLPLRALIDFDTFIYRQLSVVGTRLGRMPGLGRGLMCTPPIYVFLGSDTPNADRLERLITHELSAVAAGARGHELPIEVPEKYRPVWDRLLARLDKNQPLADLVLDGDPATVSSAEVMAYETVAEAFSGKVRAVLKDRYERTALLENEYLPWLRGKKPELVERVEKIYSLLTPDWLSGNTKNPSGWTLPRERVLEAYRLLTRLEPDVARRSEDFLDMTHALADRGLSGTQTFWLKLLRELPAEERTHLLRTVADATGKVLLAKECSESEKIGDAAYYDRSCCAYELCRESLNGLGYQEREVFARSILATLSSRSGILEERAKRVAKLMTGAADVPSKFDRNPDRLLETHREPENRDRLLVAVRRFRFHASHLEKLSPTDARLLDAHARALELLALACEEPGRVRLDAGAREKLDAPFILGEFAGGGSLPEITASMLNRAPRAEVVKLAAERRPDDLGISVVLEGGGGKGFAYAEMLKQLQASLAECKSPRPRIDEYVGTSAGAITAGLLAAGFEPGELVELLRELSFTKFFSDYFAMMGGLDPRLRGAGRSGIFSTRTMYETIHRLLSEKLGITDGGPVLFKDLPHNLKVVSTVVSTNLPRALKEELGIGPDGRVVFGKETTPNMDVAAAIVASAAVPVFFRPPELHVCAKNAEGSVEQYRLQLVDGGVLENLPAAAAARAENGKTFMLMIPTFVETDLGKGRDVRLSTLDFEPKDRLPQIDAYNRDRFAPAAGALPKFLEKSRRAGYERGTIVFNLATPREQPRPIIQGEGRKDTRQLNRIAYSVRLYALPESRSRKVFAANQPAKGLLDRLGQYALDAIDGQNVFEPARGERGRTYRIPKNEVETFGEVVLSTVSGALVTKERLGEKLFEKPE